MKSSVLAFVALLPLVSLGCAATSEEEPQDRMDARVLQLSPSTILPGTRLVADVEGFAGAEAGNAVITIRSGSSTISLPAEIGPGAQTLTAEMDEAAFERLGAGPHEAVVRAVVSVAGQVAETEAHNQSLRLATHLTPELAAVPDGVVLYVNDTVAVVADELLLPGEGATYAVLEGCFQAQGSDNCAELPTTRIPLQGVSVSRQEGGFVFAPSIAGVGPGSFQGQVTLENEHRHDGSSIGSETLALSTELLETTLTGSMNVSASLGQYVDFEGGGFIGQEDGLTLLSVSGQFVPSGGGAAVEFERTLVPEFVSGRRLRWVMSEVDFEGVADLRGETGLLTASVRPLLVYQGEELTGQESAMALEVAPIKQVIVVRFTSAYQKSLKRYGLAAADMLVRDRAIAVLNRDYRTINVDVRTEDPGDFALYSEVEIGGPDPNGLGLIGYDNTPGKDVGNERLYDKLGGVNAVTQQDGYPGYGGVFIESLFVYSNHPAGDYEGVDTSATGSELFDEVFDPVREDRGGEVARAADLSCLVPSGTSCPGLDRSSQVGCAIWTLRSLIGTTLSHEIAHSLGLADPFGLEFHNSGDGANRIMDKGTARPFAERAELAGQGPGVFCDEHYTYLRMILPGNMADDSGVRPSCQ